MLLLNITKKNASTTSHGIPRSLTDAAQIHTPSKSAMVLRRAQRQAEALKAFPTNQAGANIFGWRAMFFRWRCLETTIQLKKRDWGRILEERTLMDFEKILLKRFSRNFWCTLNLHRNARLVGAFLKNGNLVPSRFRIVPTFDEKCGILGCYFQKRSRWRIRLFECSRNDVPCLRSAPCEAMLWNLRTVAKGPKIVLLPDPTHLLLKSELNSGKILRLDWLHPGILT